MIKKIIGTLMTRIMVAGMTLLIVLINQRVLGAEKVGTIAQIILAVTIIQLVSNIIGGGSLVYLVPRAPLMALLIFSYFWSALVAVAGTFLLGLFSTTRADGFMIHVLFLSLLLSFSTINLMVLMGKEKIRQYNSVTLVQAFIMLAVLLFLFFINGIKNIGSYVTALYFSYAFGFAVSTIMILPWLKAGGKDKGHKDVLKTMFDYGIVMQAGNIIQFFNYRLGYYFVTFFLGKAPLGIYSVGTSLSESLWILGKSISTVQYARISNESDPAYAARLTLSFVKICFVLTLLGLILLLALLFLLFPLIFRQEFEPVKYIMLILGPGILTFSVSVVLSPYFSGSGKPHHNTITAAIGLVFTIVLGVILIPRYGLAGAALSATISYSAATLYQFIVFVNVSGIRAKDFVFKRSEILSAYRFFVSLQDKKTYDDSAGNL